jgi:hypothetical protein
MTVFENPIINFIVVTVVGELIITIIGVIIAQPVLEWIQKKRFGGWHLSVIKNGEHYIDHIEISTGKMKQIDEIPEELAVFLKGKCSPFHHVNCDITEDGEALGLLFRDEKNREIIINLDNDLEQPRHEKVSKSTH